MQDKLETLEQALAALSHNVSSGFIKVDHNFDSIKIEIDSLQKKVDTLTKKVEALEGDTNDGFETVGLKLENLTEEISKISIVTKYGEEYNNLSGFK